MKLTKRQIKEGLRLFKQGNETIIVDSPKAKYEAIKTAWIDNKQLNPKR